MFPPIAAPMPYLSLALTLHLLHLRFTSALPASSYVHVLSGWFIFNFQKKIKRAVSGHLRSYSVGTMRDSFLLKFCV